GQPTSPLAISASAALVMTIRSYLGVYACPAMFLAVLQSARQGPRRLAQTVAILAVGVALAVAQIGLVNSWMTGSPWRAAYLFGDAQFSSMDWRCPHWHSVLFETYHGLIPTHPFLLLGLLSLLLLGIWPPRQRRAESRRDTEEPGPDDLAFQERGVWLL